MDRSWTSPPRWRSRLDAISGADDAPYELRELHRRVEAGSLTWEELWLAPEEEPGAGPDDAGPGGVLGR